MRQLIRCAQSLLFCAALTAQQPSSLDKLAAELTSSDPFVVVHAREALAAKGSQSTVVLLPMLAHGDSAQQLAAIRVLAHIRDARIAPALTSIALGGNNPATIQAAAHALGELPAPHALDGLIASLNGTDTHRRQVALGLLRDVGPRAISALATVLHNGTEAERYAAINSLAVIDDPATVPPLLDALHDSSHENRLFAIQGLHGKHEP